MLRGFHSSRYRREIMRYDCRLTGPPYCAVAPVAAHTYPNGFRMRQNVGIENNPSMAGEQASNVMIDARERLPRADVPKAPSLLPVISPPGSRSVDTLAAPPAESSEFCFDNDSECEDGWEMGDQSVSVHSEPEIEKPAPENPTTEKRTPEVPHSEKKHCEEEQGKERIRLIAQNAIALEPERKQVGRRTETVEEGHQQIRKQERENSLDRGECDRRPPCATLFQMLQYDDTIDPRGQGLLYYQKFWHLSEVEISVRGELLHGTALEFHQNTLRLINDTHSYYIPLRQVDYIRTDDGLKTCFSDGRFGPVPPLRVSP